MKTRISKILLSIVGVFLLVSIGCSTGIDANYAAYTEAMKAQFAHEEKPLMKLDLYESGKVKGIEMNQQHQIVQLQQKRPSPIWGIVGQGLHYAGIFGTIWAAGHSLDNIIEDVAKYGGHNITIGNGNNWSGGRDANVAFGGGVNLEGNTNTFNPLDPTTSTSTATATGEFSIESRITK